MVEVARRSKNDLFSTTFSPILPPASPSRPSTPTSKPAAPIRPHVEPSAPSPPIPAPVVTTSSSLKLRLSKETLGNGRHATVYLASYRSTSEGSKAPWKLCAAKRLSADKEAQLAGLNEAMMLSRLAGRQQIISYIGLQDEGDTTASSSISISKGRTNGLEVPQRPPLHERSSSNSGARSVPSSPMPQHESQRGFPFLAGENELVNESASMQGSSLRRASTVKARKPPCATETSERNEHTRDVGTTEIPRLVLLTEYCHLGNLAQFVGEHGTSHLGQNMFFKLAMDLLKAVVACHDKNIIHGDLKPQNCMIDSAFNLKLGDFSSSVFNSPNLVDGIALGTTQYSPPELIKPPPSPFSFPVDVFSAGLVLLYMLSGVEPYESLLAPSRAVSRRTSPSRKKSGLSGAATIMRRNRARTSSGAGKIVEMHLHLAKGHAWEWEERRRLEELEDSVPFHTDSDQCCLDARRPGRHCIAVSPLDTQGLLDEYSPSVSAQSSEIPVPAHLRDSSHEKRSSTRHETYADGYTPTQKFLTGQQTVPASLRALIQEMLSPAAADRPTAREALDRLEMLRPDPAGSAQ